MRDFFKVSASFLLILGLVGCGESSSLGSSSSLTVETAKQIEFNNNKMDIDFSVKSSYPDDVEVRLEDLRVNVTPSSCIIKNTPIFTPSEILLSGAETKNVHAVIEFENGCIPTSYQLDGKSELRQNGKSNNVSFASPIQEVIVSNNTDETSVGGVSNTNNQYSFTNVPEEIVISKANEQRSFRVQLIDENEQVVSGKSISISSYNVAYGELENMQVVTDLKGFANFSFTSPTSLESIDGTVLSLKLNYIEDKSIILSTIVKLNFNASDVTTGSSKYKFQNATSLIVGHASEEQTISIDLIDGAGVGVSGKNIQITTLDNKYGSFTSSTAQTNAAGRASFVYTSPKDFDLVDGQSTTAILTFTEDGASITQIITISLQKSTDNIDTDKVLPTVVIPAILRNTTLTSNSKNIEIQISVFKDISPYTEGTVKVELPSKVLNGIDVGSFSLFEVPVNEQGIATFNYTGPANLKALFDMNDTSSIFKFYHSANSDEASRQEMKVNYDPSADTYVPIDYLLAVNSQNDDFSMGIPDLQKTFSIILKDTQGNIINDNDVNITKIVVATENSYVAKIFDTTTNSTVDRLELRSENNSAFILKSHTSSGIVPIKIDIDFIDINKKDTHLSTIVNVRVMSGPPSAISVSYVSTGQDSEKAKYEEKFAISVTDEYGNKVNTKPYISLGAIVGYTVDGKEALGEETNNTRRLFYGKHDDANGSILPGATPSSTTFQEDSASSSVFKYVNAEGSNTDKLVIFGSGKNYEAMGKWDFDQLDNRVLSLQDDYFGVERNKLYYAVGHNYYQDQCRDDGREWIGSTNSDTYQLDDEGTVIVSYKYDYHLTGKDALVWINLNGFQADTGKNTRIGEVVKHTLRGKGFTKVPSAGYSLEKGASTNKAFFHIWHENAPERYRNGHFGWRVKLGSTCSYYVVNTSNNYDARTCENGGATDGQSYLQFYLQAPIDKACSFDIEGIVVADEF